MTKTKIKKDVTELADEPVDKSADSDLSEINSSQEIITSDLVKVKVIRQNNEMSLVEFVDNGILKRVSLSSKKINDEQVSKSLLDKSIPYGIPFEELKFPQLSALDIGNEFRKQGLWTPDSIRNSPPEVHAALMSIAGKYYSVLLEYIKNK